VNYRYFHKITNEEFDELVSELRSGARSDIPAHGTLAQVRQHIPADRLAGSVVPENTDVPVWLSVSEDGNA
jgi:NADH-quinone oxidoreductase subunit E